MIRTPHAAPRDPEIIVTPHDIIVIEARPPVTADEVAWYGRREAQPMRIDWRNLLTAGLFIALLCVSAYLILSPTMHDAVLALKRLWAGAMP